MKILDRLERVAVVLGRRDHVVVMVREVRSFSGTRVVDQ
jgi:hypothetical protein